MIDFAAARTAMVDCQVRPADVTLYPVIDAMLAVPRERYVPAPFRDVAYAGEHIRLGEDRVVLDPRLFGKMLDALRIGEGELVLDVGAGLGYSTAVLARLGQAVIGVESDAEMAAAAVETLAAEGVDSAVIETGPLVDGDAAHAPYDVILIEGGVETIPDALVAQLKDGGRMAAIFVEASAAGAAGQMRLGLKTGGTMNWRYAFDAAAPVLPGFHSAEKFVF